MYAKLAKEIGKTLTTKGNYLVESVSATNMSTKASYETLSVTVPKPFVYQVELNRPNKLNALNRTMWFEIGKCFDALNDDEDCRAIVITGAGKLFTAGIDLNDMMSLSQELAEKEDLARKGKILTILIKKYQYSMTSLERCLKPVIAAVHGPCVGAGVDLITAADIRYCSSDAWFQVKEVDIGMAADVGTLQRLPKVIGSDSLARELCYTARKLKAPEALSCGLVSQVFDDKDSLITNAIDLAANIAEKSPVGVQGTKMSLVYSRDHTVEDGLEQIGNHNKAMLQSEDFVNAVMGQLTKEKTTFSKL